MKKIIALMVLVVTFFSCDVAQQVAGTYNMSQCKYAYNSISGLSLAGVNLQNASSLTSLNPLASASLLSAFSSSSGTLPLNFTLNLNVKNSGTQSALLNGLSYILEIDGNEMTQGTMNQAFQVAGGQQAVLPIAMSFDLKSALKGQSLESIKNLAFNFAGIGNSTSQVTVKLKPNFNIGGQIVASPVYVPVSFTLNKK